MLTFDHTSSPALDPVLQDIPTELRTARLLLRPPRPGDGAEFFAAVAESLPELRRFLSAVPWIGAEQSLQAAEIHCRTSQANFLARKDLPYLVFEQEGGTLVGGVGLHRTVWSTPRTEVGYWCRSGRTGRGYVTESVQAITAMAFAQLRAVRVELVTDEENQASRRVAERCGFQLEGLLRHERRGPDGSLRNTCIYARLPEQPAGCA